MASGEVLWSKDVNEINRAGREKFWSELTDSEKIERMHGVIKSYQSELSRIQKVLGELAKHKHNDNGKPVAEKDISYYAGECEQTFSNKNEVYF